MDDNLLIQFLQYYLSVSSEYEYHFKEIKRRLCLKNISYSDLIEFIMLAGEQKGFERCYNDLCKLFKI